MLLPGEALSQRPCTASSSVATPRPMAQAVGASSTPQMSACGASEWSGSAGGSRVRRQRASTPRGRGEPSSRRPAP
eukprot:9978453-Alexandrium_andersonii.AAC.1